MTLGPPTPPSPDGPPSPLALALAHAGLAASVLCRYEDLGVDADELRDAARAGLVAAAASFDPEAGVDFVTYALPFVRAAVKRCFRDAGGRIDGSPTRSAAPVLHHPRRPASSAPEDDGGEMDELFLAPRHLPNVAKAFGHQDHS